MSEDLSAHLLEDLNENQREAVVCCDAPSLVIAGAGSGKTRVLTYKIAYLMQQGMEPWSILALTFTNKAAREMRERIGRLVGEHEASMLWMGTFHSVFYRILRYESEHIGFTSHFTIYDESDSRSLIKNIIREMGLDEKKIKPGGMLRRISEAKNKLIKPSNGLSYVNLSLGQKISIANVKSDLLNLGFSCCADYVSKLGQFAIRGGILDIFNYFDKKLYCIDFDDDIINSIRIIDLKSRDVLEKRSELHITAEVESSDLFSRLYSVYQQRLRQADAMDFDDLLLYTYVLLKENPDVRRKYEERFQYVLVDEYQDTNYAQHQIVWLLTEHRQRVAVVGDDAQSIYSFRGARIDNILTFQQAYQGARLFKLEQNYRSTQTIVNAANSVISNNRRQIHKQVFSRQAEGLPIEVCEAYSDKEEAAIVARKIYELVHGQYDYSQITILYRTNDQSRIFEEEFLRRKYPYRIYGGLSFYSRKVVKDALAYLRLAVNPRDEEALRRIINRPARGIGNTTLDKVFRLAVDRQTTPWSIINDPYAFGLEVNKPTAGRLQAFAQLINSAAELVPTEQADTVAIRLLKESGLASEINAGREPEDRENQANFQELVDSITAFVSDRREEGLPYQLTDFLQLVSLLTDQDKDEGSDANSITLMTLHAAKGLEFPVVFIVGMEENLFPNEMSLNEGNLEEERRLCYVGITRAAERLFLSWSHSRLRHGKFENNQRSRFLREIDQNLISKGQKPQSSLLFGTQRPMRPAVVPTPQVQRPVFNKPQAPSIPPSPSGTSSGTIAPGTTIIHNRFGRGVVTSVEGTGLDTKATVQFDNAGVKQLLLRFAKFEVVD